MLDEDQQYNELSPILLDTGHPHIGGWLVGLPHYNYIKQPQNMFRQSASRMPYMIFPAYFQVPTFLYVFLVFILSNNMTPQKKLMFHL